MSGSLGDALLKKAGLAAPQSRDVDEFFARAAAVGSEHDGSLSSSSSSSTSSTSSSSSGSSSDSSSSSSSSSSKSNDDASVPPSPHKSTVDNGSEPVDSTLSKTELVEKSRKDAARTIFVGNVPLDSKAGAMAKQLKRLFKDYAIESLRFRSIPFKKTGARKKDAWRTGSLDTEQHGSMNAYVVLKDTQEAHRLFADFRGKRTEVAGHVLRIDLAANSARHDTFKTVFVGNVPPLCSDDSLRKHFESVATVDRLRIVRDPKTLQTKGIAYVTFMRRASVQLAIEQLHGVVFEDGYKLRVSECRASRADRSGAAQLTMLPKSARAALKSKLGMSANVKKFSRARTFSRAFSSHNDTAASYQGAMAHKKRRPNLKRFRKENSGFEKMGGKSFKKKRKGK